ncbi:hypothetical protein [Nocardioides sp. 503]|uniref:hypothetical protein n=1 Tax=Nocardioides sp. 503 TaxID=2508326 RepID=UPI00106F7121|nr:hypothetical protein [Nocardioides sp. 503]
MRSSGTATALPDGAGLLHVGMPKTGTTALQAALFDARPQLRELGVRNVSRGRHDMRVALTAAGTLPPYWDTEPFATRWQQLSERFRTSTDRCTIWSSETLTQAGPERVRYLADQLRRDGHEVHVVLTLRALAPLLASQWQEVLRRRGTDPLDVWLHRHFDAVDLDGTTHVTWTRVMPELHRLSLRRVLQEWGPVFGEDRITFVVGEPSDRLFNLRVFEGLMGVPEGTLLLQDLDNASLPYPEAEMVRHFNLAYTEGGGDHATWMYTVGGPGQLALRELTGLAPYPIRTPRWAARRANEYVEGWIEAVEASDARVIGDLANLLVDPEDHPDDTTPPETVSVASAGRIAEILFASGLEHDPATAATLEGTSGRELLREVGRRVRGRIGRRA